MKDFFPESLGQKCGAQYTWERIIHGKIWVYPD